MIMRTEFHPHDHAWLAQFGVTMPTSRTAAVRRTLREMAGGAGQVFGVALATVGAWHLAVAFAPGPMAAVSTVITWVAGVLT